MKKAPQPTLEQMLEALKPFDKPSTIVLVQSDTDAPLEWAQKHFPSAQVVDIVRIDRLLPSNHIVVVVVDPTKTRLDRGKPMEPTPIKVTPPVNVGVHWDDTAEGGGLVRLGPLLDAVAPNCAPGVFRIADGKIRVLSA